MPISTYVTQHIKMGQLSQKFKIDFSQFPKWLAFQLNFSATSFEIGHCSGCGNFTNDIITDC